MEHIFSLSASFVSNFFLVTDERIKSSTPPHPSIRQLKIVPEFDDKDNQTSRFNLEVTFILESEKAKPEARIVADLAREILDFYLSFIAFLTGDVVNLVKPPEITLNYPGTKKYRRIFFPKQAKDISPPIPLSNVFLFSVPISQKLSTALGLVHLAIQQKETLTSFMLLWAALELIANQFEQLKWSPKACIKCGYIYQKNPSTTDRIKHLILNELGFSEDRYEAIWTTRNKIAHGGLDLTYENRRKIFRVRNDLYLAVIKAMKELLKISKSDYPAETPPFNTIYDALLDIDYTLP